jgi:1-acyl-sn-glycerol-3-phosphate acyltransferase
MQRRPLRRWVARCLLVVTGWKPDGERPEVRRCVLIAAPHTTNWDFFYLLIFAAFYGVPIRWMGKDSLFRPPFGWLMRSLGGIPIVRHRSGNVVAAMARSFEGRRELVLVVPAEGTRSRREYWKSGFYHIACQADVPIVMSYLDYTEKRGGFGGAFRPTGDVREDMGHVRAFYAGKDGKYPERFSRIRLREEGEKGDEAPPRPLLARIREES